MKLTFKILLFTILISACTTKKTEQTTTEADNKNTITLTNQQIQNLKLTTDTLQKINLAISINASGVVDVPPQNLVSVSFPLGGYLKSTHLLPGTSIKKNEVLAVLEDQAYVQLQQDYLTTKAKLEFLTADVERQKALANEDAVSKKNYQQVLSEYKMQQINLKALEQKLNIIGINTATLTVNNISRTVYVKSPIEGYVTKVNVNIGKYINPGEVMFELVNPDDIHAAITVYEKDFGYIKKHLQGNVWTSDNPSTKYPIEVVVATKNMDSNRAGLVHCHFKNHNHDLLPGMFLMSELFVDAKQVYALPKSAIINNANKKYVFTAAANNSFNLVEITTGLENNNYAEILNYKDLLHQKVITQNSFLLWGAMNNTGEEE